MDETAGKWIYTVMTGPDKGTALSAGMFTYEENTLDFDEAKMRAECFNGERPYPKDFLETGWPKRAQEECRKRGFTLKTA